MWHHYTLHARLQRTRIGRCNRSSAMAQAVTEFLWPACGWSASNRIVYTDFMLNWGYPAGWCPSRWLDINYSSSMPAWLTVEATSCQRIMLRQFAKFPGISAKNVRLKVRLLHAINIPQCQGTSDIMPMCHMDFFTCMTLCLCSTCHQRMSRHPSVTSRCSTKMAKPRITLTTPCDSPGTLVFWCLKSRQNSNGVTRNGDAK